MKKQCVFIIAAVLTSMLLIAGSADAKNKKHYRHGFPPPVIVTVTEDEVLVIDDITNISVLKIAEGGSVVADEGYSLTMTVNGVETPIAAGIFRGKIVLTPTEQIRETSSGGPGGGSTAEFRTALYIEDGAVVPEKSVFSAVVGGKVTDDYAKNIKISSVGPNFNGIITTSSDSSTERYSYTIEKPKINFVGNGGNDFAGYGAAISTKGYSDVVVNKAKIITDGVIRGAVFCGGNSTVTVNDSYIHTGSPELPEVISGMMSVPWPLGLTGTCRSTIVVGNGTGIYNNSHIVADGWGALSTDACQDVKLYANNCLIETIESGYGSYADGTSLDVFNKCRFNVTDMALILTQGDAVFTNETIVNSGRFGVMQHSGRGGDGENLTIEDGCVFNTEEAVFMIKSSGPNISVDRSRLNSKNGIILQGMISDDAGSGTNGGTINADFSNMNLKGDIYNAMTSLGDMVVTFANVKISGVISTSTWTTQASVDGVDLTIYGPFDTDGYIYSDYIGRGFNTLCDPDEAFGLEVTLDSDSIWVIDKTCYLTGLTLDAGADLIAAPGKTVTMTVNGASTPISAGSYAGKIVLTVE